MRGLLETEFLCLRVLLIFIGISEIKCQGISCFKCTVTPNLAAREETSQICSQFDGSAHFQIYCPKSTLCMKRTIHHALRNGTLVKTSVERGCAQQLDTFHSWNFDLSAWQSEEKIVNSAYEEGCFIGEDRGSPGGPSEYCYCKFPLCNNAKTFNRSNNVINLIILMLFFDTINTINTR